MIVASKVETVSSRLSSLFQVSDKAIESGGQQGAVSASANYEPLSPDVADISPSNDIFSETTRTGKCQYTLPFMIYFQEAKQCT